MNALLELRRHGQSVWLDYIRRDLVRGGELLRMIKDDDLRGVTSNPAIFEKAISGSSEYDQAMAEMYRRDPARTPASIYDTLAIEDVQGAADVLRPVFDSSGGADGFVSIEPPPQVTSDTKATVEEGLRLWGSVNRPNVMIKVVATKEGVAAVEQLIGRGVNVNITLIFSVRHYEAVANAYLKGLQQCTAPEKVASVASFFVSRVDTLVDKELEKAGSDEAKRLQGKIAIANARKMYQQFEAIFHGEAFAGLRRRGARVQRPLWASTGTKNPAYSDVLYVNELVGPETVNTIPPETLAAFRDHGEVRGNTVLEGVGEAEADLAALARIGIDLDRVADQLQVDGVKLFAAAYDRVLKAISEKKGKTMASVG